MPRFDIDGKGTVIELSEYGFLLAIESLADSYYGLAEGYISNHASGLADFRGTHFKGFMALIQEQVKTIEPEIDDKELHEVFHSLVLYLRRLSEIDEQIVQVQAKLNGFLSIHGQRDRIKLEQRVKKRRTEFLSRPMPAELQPLATESMSIMSLVQETRQHLQRRIHQLLATLDTEAARSQKSVVPAMVDFAKETPKLANWTTRSSETAVEFGDQRAKDLIDEADGELDPKRAVKLLHKALRYGRTGIQASKAYMGLGMRYEDLGDTARAIKYYTKAIGVGGPSAIILFWRGQLYYQRKQWKEARSDFEQALAFPPGEGLVSPERELAESHLVELNNPYEKS